MGIYDRDYVRSAPQPGFGGALVSHGAVAAIVAANVFVFALWQIYPGAPFMERLFTVSADGVLRHWRLHTLVTAEFSHQGVMHLFWNMLYLWWFGKELEESIYGTRSFLFLYFFGAIAASLAHVALTVSTGGASLGASGAVMAILVVCAFLFPGRPIYIWGIFPIALKWLVVVYVAADLLPVLNGHADGIDHPAHLGGAAAGVAFYLLDLRIFRRAGAPGPPLLGRIAALFRRGPKMRVVRGGKSLGPLDDVPPGPYAEPPPAPAPSSVDRATADRVDDLLRKIAERGMDGLSPEEREFLKAASGKYRK